MERLASNIKVEVLDASALCKHTQTELKLKGDRLEINGKVGIIRTPKGIFIVMSEGDFSEKPLSKRNTWEIDMYFAESITPIAVCSISDEDISRLKVIETIWLEDFIRSFGRRTEHKYEKCREFMARKLKGN